MNLLYHHRTQGSGAEGVHIREIVNAFRELGNTVWMVSPPKVDVFKRDIDNRFGSAKSVSLFSRLLGWASRHAPEVMFELMELGYNIVASVNLHSTIRKHKVQAIYERYHFFGWAGSFLARRHKLRVILEVNEISGIERVRGQALKWLARRIEDYVFRNAHAIIVVSAFLKERIVATGVNDEKILVLPNGVNARKFNPGVAGSGIRERLGTKGVTIGFVGYLVRWHNFELLMSGFGEAVKQCKDLHLMLVGNGPMKKELEALLDGMGLRDRVKFVDNIGHDEVPSYISAMDICIIPHSNEYRSPIKLFEYMAVGKPVIAPRLKPIESIITNGVNGLLFPLNDKDEFTRTLMMLTRDAALRESLGRAASDTILQGHTWRKNAEKMLALFPEEAARAV